MSSSSTFLLRRPNPSWRWVVSVGIAIIVTFLAVQTKAQERIRAKRVSIDRAAIPDNTTMDFVPPAVFQAAGPNIASIQGTITDFRAALGDPVNGNTLTELDKGRREINWDGAVPTDVTT